MSDCNYQDIRDAEQTANDAPALPPGEANNEAFGHVILDEKVVVDPDHAVICEILFPDHKRETFRPCVARFDPFHLDRSDQIHHRVSDTKPRGGKEALTILI